MSDLRATRESQRRRAGARRDVLRGRPVVRQPSSRGSTNCAAQLHNKRTRGRTLVVYDISKHVCVCQRMLIRNSSRTSREGKGGRTFPTAPSPTTTYSTRNPSFRPISKQRQSPYAVLILRLLRDGVAARRGLTPAKACVHQQSALEPRASL